MRQIYNGIMLKMVNKVVHVAVDNVNKLFSGAYNNLHNILPKPVEMFFGDNLSHLFTTLENSLNRGYFVFFCRFLQRYKQVFHKLLTSYPHFVDKVMLSLCINKFFTQRCG